MKHIDYLYFNIYSYFYRSSPFRQSAISRILAMYLFSLGSGGWVLLAESVYLKVVKHTRFASRGEATLFAMSLYLLAAVLFNYIFIVKDRDQKIFGKYEEMSNQNPKRKRHLVISAWVLILPYLGLMAFAFFSPKH